MKTKLAKVKLGEITFDAAIYPRDSVDPENIRAIVRAIEAGVELPPIRVCDETLRIVDGAHRFRAMERVYQDPESIVTVERVRYVNESVLFLDAIRLNAGHGKRLSSYDVATIATRAEKFQLTREQLSVALSMTVEAYESLTVDRVADSSGGPVLVKRTIRHLAGEKLTGAETRANESLSGMQAKFYVRQVLALLSSRRMIRWDDAEMIEDLAKLRDALIEALDVNKATA